MHNRYRCLSGGKRWPWPRDLYQKPGLELEYYMPQMYSNVPKPIFNDFILMNQTHYSASHSKMPLLICKALIGVPSLFQIKS